MKQRNKFQATIFLKLFCILKTKKTKKTVNIYLVHYSEKHIEHKKYIIEKNNNFQKIINGLFKFSKNFDILITIFKNTNQTHNFQRRRVFKPHKIWYLLCIQNRFFKTVFKNHQTYPNLVPLKAATRCRWPGTYFYTYLPFLVVVVVPPGSQTERWILEY